MFKEGDRIKVNRDSDEIATVLEYKTKPGSLHLEFSDGSRGWLEATEDEINAKIGAYSSEGLPSFFILD